MEKKFYQIISILILMIPLSLNASNIETEPISAESLTTFSVDLGANSELCSGQNMALNAMTSGAAECPTVNCNVTLVEYTTNCDDPSDCLNPSNISGSLINVSGICPTNGPNYASCAGNIICISSSYTDWDFSMTAASSFQFQEINANFWYPTGGGNQAGADQNLSSCPTSFNAVVKFYLNGSLQDQKSITISENQLSNQTIAPTSSFEVAAGSTVKVIIEGIPVSTDCDMIELASLKVKGCQSNGMVCSTPDLSSLDGTNVNGLSVFNASNITIGNTTITGTRSFTGGTTLDEDKINASQTSGAVGIRQGVSGTFNSTTAMFNNYLFSQDVCDLQITIWDIDSNDELILAGSNNGVNVSYTVDYLGSCVSQTGNNFKDVCGNQTNASDNNRITITFNGCIDDLDIQFWSNSNGSGGSYTLVWDEGCDVAIVSENNTYSWSGPGISGETNSTVLVDGPGTYCVTVTDCLGNVTTDCKTLTCDPCSNAGGDTDGDGVCDNDDCQPSNPNYPAVAGTACNDGNPNTENDVVQGDGCSCAGTPIGPCVGDGDNDGDGVCNNDDCFPWNPTLPAPIGSPCDDGNPNTTNDVTVGDECNCVGTGGIMPNISINDITVNENAGTATLQICIPSPSGQNVSVQYSTSSGSALMGSDFEGSNGTATITAGQTCTQVSVPIIEDLTEEPNETFTVNLTNPQNGNIIDPQGTVTIIDNDGQAGCANPINLALNKPAVQSSTITAGGITGSASKAVDGNTNGVFFTNPTSASSVSATTNEYQAWWEVDLGAEYNIEQVKLWNRTDGQDKTDDCYLIISSTPFAPGDLNGALNQANYSHYEQSAVGSPSIDNPNTTGRYVRIQLNTTGYLILAEVEVIGCEISGGGNPSISINDVTVNENAGTASLTLSLSAPSNSPVTVAYSTNNGTATNPSDYTPVSGTVTFPTGSTTATVVVPIINDNIAEPTESLVVNLANPSGATIADPQGTITITDDDDNDPCAGQGDNDGDGVCNALDCFPWNPTLPASIGSPCDDGNPNTTNDMVVGDECNCEGTSNPDPCANAGGDTDGDGVCNNDDCQPNNPNFPATPGTSCDDGNPNTFDDIITSDGCGCQGVICSTPNLNSLNGTNTNGLNLFNAANITVANATITGTRTFTGGTSLDEDAINSSQTSGTVGIRQGVNATFDSSTSMLNNYSFDQEVCDLQITIWDIDSKDELILTGTNNGANVSYSTDFIGSCVSQTGNNFKDICSTQTNAANGNRITITFNGCIDNLAIKFWSNANGSGGSYTLVWGEGCESTNVIALIVPNMLNFNAKKEGRHSAISWIMTKDVDVDYYDVEVSTDKVTFRSIGEVTADQVETPRGYDLMDYEPVLGENFYRLKVVNMDGTYYYSGVRRLQFIIDFSEVVVYPNPSNDNINITLRDFAGKEGTVEIFNQLGQRQLGRDYLSLPTIPVNFDISRLVPGIYTVSIKVDNQRRFAKKFIVIDK